MTDRTVQFAELVRTFQKQLPSSAGSGSHILRSLRPRQTRDPFIQEADKIAIYIARLHTYLLQIRRSYLGLGNDPLDNQPSGSGASECGLQNMLPTATPHDISLMSGEQRDILDMQIQAVIRGCLEMIQTLARLVVSPPSVPQAKGMMRGMLATPLQPLTNAHVKTMRESVVWILEHRLMAVSNIQRNMQEYRHECTIRRQENLQHKNLGDLKLISRKVSEKTSPASATERLSPLRKFTTNTVKSHLATVIPGAFRNRTKNESVDGIPAFLSEAKSKTGEMPHSPTQSHNNKETTNTSYGLSTPDGDSDDDLDLTPQLQAALESENAAMIHELEGTLDQVRNATQSLNEIAQLQSTLAHHLQAQSETIDTIYDDAWKASETISKGNENLQSAKKYFGGPRYWVLYFMLIASALLLLLDAFS
ncbi:hypothetical protein BASA81_013633 [Batrachochytrium salamandrivorans]|nr:hypothetical protein BASA62_002591 [Batrachochytrium salamandrivorans]KAH9248699.1 hypothetical protein BASA81_013633 [Batrachochytrium salamandrivorans]